MRAATDVRHLSLSESPSVPDPGPPSIRERFGTIPKSARALSLAGCPVLKAFVAPSSHDRPRAEARRSQGKVRSGSIRAPVPVDGFTRLLWWLLGSSAGAPTRAAVLRALRREPRNAQQLATALGLDYTTVRHHLRVLLANHLVETTGEHYGQVYSVSATLEARWADLEHILERKAKR